jgi:hypothetical protein
MWYFLLIRFSSLSSAHMYIAIFLAPDHHFCVEVCSALAGSTAARAAAAFGSFGSDRIEILPAALLAAEAEGVGFDRLVLGPSPLATRRLE